MESIAKTVKRINLLTLFSMILKSIRVLTGAGGNDINDLHPMVYFPFDKDAAQAAAVYFTLQEGGCINKMKLCKLMYIAERMSLQESESPLFGGMYCSLAYGPVISEVLSAIDANYWQGLNLQQYDVVLKPNTEFTTDAMSDWGHELIVRVYEQYGKMNQWELSDWTHREFAEWKDPGKGRREMIAIRDIVLDGGEALEELAGELSYLREL